MATKINKQIVKPKFIITQRIIEWKLIPTGTYFTAKYASGDGDKAVSGIVIQKQDYTYLVHNTEEADFDCEFMGWPYSIAMDTSCKTDESIKENYELFELKFPKAPKGLIIPIITDILISGHEVQIFKGKIKVGCQEIDNTTVRKIAKLLKD